MLAIMKFSVIVNYNTKSLIMQLWCRGRHRVNKHLKSRKMNKHFIQVTNGLLPVAVLVLLAVAFIAGQARANLPSHIISVSAPAFSTNANIILNADLLRSAELLPHVVDSIMISPAEIELNFKLLKNVPSADGVVDRSGSGQ